MLPSVQNANFFIKIIKKYNRAVLLAVIDMQMLLGYHAL